MVLTAFPGVVGAALRAGRVGPDARLAFKAAGRVYVRRNAQKTTLDAWRWVNLVWHRRYTAVVKYGIKKK